MKLSDILSKLKAIQPLSKDLQDVSDIVKKHIGITIPIEKIKIQKTVIVFEIEQIKKSLIFRKEDAIKQDILTILKLRIDKII